MTDSPVLLQCVYAALKDYEAARYLVNMALRYETAYTSVNFLVGRCVAYDPSGRFQTPGALAELDHRIQADLKNPARALSPWSPRTGPGSSRPSKKRPTAT